MIKVLELFAGSRSIAKQAESVGGGHFQVFSSDITPFEGIDYVVDIMDFDINKLPFRPDVVWASPPCTGFSVAAIGKNWNHDNTPKTDTARLGLKIVEKTLQIIDELQPKYFFIENPRGKLRKLPVMKIKDIIRHTVTYCQYGDDRMKPTDIWTNNENWNPKPICKNGDTCHVAAPRGSKTGTQGLKGAYARSMIPAELCREILLSCLPEGDIC